MQDSERLVGLVERILYLKTASQFAGATSDQLAAIAEHLEERFFPPGATLFRAGDFAGDLQFIIEGRVGFRDPVGFRACGAGEVVGAPAVFEGRPRFATAVAETEVRTLALRAEDLFDLLEDHFDLARAVIRALAGRVLRLRADRDGEPDGERSGPPFCTVCDAPLDLVQKVVFLKSVRPLRSASVDELVRLAGEVDEAHAAAGELLLRPGDPATCFYLVLSGRIGRHGPRDIVGGLAALAQAAHAAAVRVDQDAHLLRVPGEAFFDLIEDHFDLLRGVVQDLSRTARELEGPRG